MNPQFPNGGPFEKGSEPKCKVTGALFPPLVYGPIACVCEWPNEGQKDAPSELRMRVALSPYADFDETFSELQSIKERERLARKQAHEQSKFKPKFRRRSS